jgi:alpha-N-arabinofuranosidase
MKRHNIFILAFSALLFCKTEANAQSAPSITLKLDQPGHSVPPQLYGLMTEEINYSYDGFMLN